MIDSVGKPYNFNVSKNKKERVKCMGMTMTQKILAAHAGLNTVKAGQLIKAKLDLVLGNDITSQLPSMNLKRLVLTKFFIRIKSHW